MNLFLYGIAQLGRRTERTSALSMLAEPIDLPGSNWKTLGDRSRRVGFERIGVSAEYKRSRRAGLFTASRYFEQVGASRYCWVQVIPFASAADADVVIPKLEQALVRDPRTETSGTGRRIDPRDAPEVAEYPFIIEHSVVQKQGISIPRMVAGNVEHVVFVVSCSEFGEGWAWSEIAPVAAAEASKIRNALVG